jgi:hypothetical protein
MNLPWDTGRTFRVAAYGAGHSHLILRAEGAGTDVFNVLFEDVRFMRLHNR